MLDLQEQYLRYHYFPTYPVRQNKALIKYQPRPIAVWSTQRRSNALLARSSYPLQPVLEAPELPL